MKLQSSSQRPRNDPAVERGEFRHWEWTGSAENSWISGQCVLKPLILEASAATSHPGFATSHVAFAMSLFSTLAGDAPSFLLSNSLKKKKKEYEEGQGIRQYLVPRVGAVLPSVAHAAYFLGHQFSGVAMVE
ncbi:hypothetical protein [Paraburkholderia nodosa]|uniref:hypothetical protein n=1 Tax=Paraburkholderia nodosa TaxID=392320 RepID=UPI0012B69A8B|nr:hypothetical protein [Paraburkholderia nodosa]